MNRFYDQFKTFSGKNELWKKVHNAVVCVSGGVDSMVMLTLLLQLRKEKEFNIEVVHINHCLRGNAADKDEMLVADYCSVHSVPFHKKRVNIRRYAKEHNISIEMAGRELRYSFYHEIANNFKKAVIVTGHTLNDHVETILLRILKGTGLHGLSGIPIKRGNIVRPIRFATKSDLYNYASENNIPFSEDHTNYEDNCQRNIIRNNLLPMVLKSINPNAIETIANTSTIIEEVVEVLNYEVEKAEREAILEENSNQIILEISRLRYYFMSVKKEVLRNCIRRLEREDKKIGFKTMSNLVSLIHSGNTGSYINLTNSLTSSVDRDHLTLSLRNDSNWKNTIVEPGRKYRNDWFVFISEVITLDKDYDIPEGAGIEVIDFDKIKRELELRHWQFGDRLKPFGLGHSKKVSDLFIDFKIPRTKKDRIPILECGEEIIWVCGLKLADPFKLTHKSTRGLKLYYKEL